jgi:RNA polymerase sigma-70 factor (ECF subfamily)
MTKIVKPNYRELTENFLETRSEKDYTSLYRKVKPGLRSYIGKIVKDSEATEDILVNTLTKMWTKIDQYDPQYQITTWLYRIAFNECLGFINERNKKTSLTRLQEYGLEVNDGGTVAIETIGSLVEDMDFKTEMDLWEEDNELQARYESCLRAMEQLKPIYRDIVVDRLINKVKYEDLADKYKLPLQTIKNRIRRGKSLIAESIGQKIVETND